MSKLKSKNEYIKNDDERAVQFELNISKLKSADKLPSNIDQVKRNHVQFKFLPKNKLSAEKIFAFHFALNVGHIFREHIFKDEIRELKIINDGSYYYSSKKIDGDIMKIEYKNHKSFSTTLIKGKNIYVTTYKIVNVLGIKKVMLFIYVFGEAPISFFTLTAALSKINVKKEFSKLCKDIKKITNDLSWKIEDVEYDEILMMKLK